MILLTSIAALAAGTASAQSQAPVQPLTTTGQTATAVATQSAPTGPAKPAWKPKPKSWTLPDTSRPAGGLPTSTL